MKFQLFIVLCLAYATSAYSQAQYEAYNKAPSTGIVPTMKAPMATTEMTQENPCTEDVLRSPEIQAFVDPLDQTQYIVCTEVGVFVRMPCATGTVFNTEIRHCVPVGWVKPVCPVGLCQNQADCIIDEVKNEYKCLCRVGYTGLFCEVNIDECQLEGHNVCAKEEGTCVDQLNAYYCDFGTTIGLTRETAIEKPCTLTDLSEARQFFELQSPFSNVYLQCTGEMRWTVSRCADMLFWNQELRTCTIEKPIMKTGVCKTLPCRNDGECMDLGNFQFKCMCPSGFTGQFCEETIDFCATTEPLCGTGRCVSHRGGYNCVCENKIVDSSCSMTVENTCVEVGMYIPFPTDSTKYISCGLAGFAFVRTCPIGEFWNMEAMSCVAPKTTLPQRTRPTMSIFTPPMTAPVAPAYNGYAAPAPMAVAPMTAPVAPAYNGYAAPAPMAVAPMKVAPMTVSPMTVVPVAEKY